MTATELAARLHAAISYCRCGHAQQIHGATRPGNEGGRLTPDGPRGQGACTAKCWCESFTERAA